MAARVEQVEEIKISSGGKGETSLLQFQFTPVRVLKGVFSRDTLTLNSADLGIWNFKSNERMQRGEFRLLILGRTGEGYAVAQPAPSLDQSIPPLRDGDDELLATVKTLLEVNESTDREKSVTRMLSALHGSEGPAAVPLNGSVGVETSSRALQKSRAALASSSSAETSSRCQAAKSGY